MGTMRLLSLEWLASRHQGSLKLDLPLGQLHSAEPDRAPKTPHTPRGTSAHKQTGMSHKEMKKVFRVGGAIEFGALDWGVEPGVGSGASFHPRY